ncbi:hypothetical protein BBJ28_00017346 [Nothophytophthora sp. Chile5]|nr:hypothetical protein BBJ28_00017346 [Nothophytophthora sp. Chile5]
MSQEEVEVFSKETFLTSLNRISNSAAGNATAQNAGAIAVEEPSAMALVREKHAQLHDVVGSLSEKISAVLARQERDFLAAYRAHMYTVQKELHEMREKIHRNETVENKTEKIKKIEDERDWYRKEALRLDAFTTTMTKDLKYMKENLEAIEEDRNWLEKQLKACKKQNKLLRAELDVRLSGPGNNAGSDSCGVLPPFDSQGKAGASGAKQMKPRGSQDTTSSTAAGTGLNGLPHLNLETASMGPTMLAEEREEKFKKQLRNLKRELQQKAHELAVMKKQQRLFRRDGDSGRSQLESFFLQCVESVKEDVSRRRDCGASSQVDRKAPSGRAAAQRGGHSTLSVEKSRRPKFDVELDDFTASDRVRLIERLLSHDGVLPFLYANIFPPDKPTATGDVLDTSRSSHASGRGGQYADEVAPTLQASASLPETASPFASFEAYSNSSSGEAATGTGEGRATTPVGSGAAAVSAVRNGALSLDHFTQEYLKSSV